MAKNNLLSEQLAYIGVSCTPTHLHLCSYNAESICMKDGKDIDSLIPYLNKNAINWIQIHGFQNTEVIQHVCQNFNVDFLTIQDILNSDHQNELNIEFAQEFVQPLPTEAEPAACTALLAAKAEYKVPVTVLFER